MQRLPLKPFAATSLLVLGLLAACVSTLPPGTVPPEWALRLPALQQNADWDMQGRAAVKVGARGWQASVDWRQHGANTTVHLAGPLGVGATLLRLDAQGLSVNDAPPSRDVVKLLQRHLGFDLPLANLRFWLLGAPDPGLPYTVALNDQDRAQRLTQAGWQIDFARYRRAGGDWLPATMTLTRPGVRVRMAIDRWDGVQ
ncbi:MAG TPA: lipoprotein insertase outer membrane protein LolB [Steroidobacteraceae bacterium]|nr:lipoprotein insertase outer membrane protein LolB [Steroidobacteraceae bacterium]